MPLIQEVRKDIHAIAQLHSPAVISLSITRQPIFPEIFQGALFADGIPIYKDARHVNTASRGNRLAMALGNAKVVVIRGHGYPTGVTRKSFVRKRRRWQRMEACRYWRYQGVYLYRRRR